MTDKEMIQTPHKWPRWPVLPVVRRSRELACGLIFSDVLTTVYLDANLFALSDVPGRTWDQKLSRFSTREYASVEELLKEWRVD